MRRWNNRRKCFRLPVLGLAAALLFVMLSSCGDTSESVQPNTAGLEKYGQELILSDGWNELAGVGNLKLSIDKESLSVSVENTVTGKVWRTNSLNPEEDTTAQGTSKDMLKAQFQLYYYDTNGNLKTMNSFTDSIKFNQTKVFSIENGIAVHYLVGDTTRGESDIPAQISNQRFTEVVLSKLNDSDAKELKGYYKYYKNDDMWAIRPAGRNNVAQVIALFDKAGYTEEDLVVDNGQFGISSLLSKKATFEVVVEYLLEDGSLRVNIPTEQLVYSEDFPLYQIKLLEDFMTATNEAEGYILLPDGSGSLIQFNQQISSRDTISIPIYGADGALKSANSGISAQTACLPVFGMKENNDGILAVIESGESCASIEAYRAGRNNDNYAVYPIFNVVNMDFIYLSGGDTLSTVPAFQNKLFDGDYSVRYLFLDEEKADYIGMADTYRNILLKSGKLQKLVETENVPIAIETIGGVIGYKSFLGVSYTGLTPATTYSQNIDILTFLSENGVKNIDLKISGWFNNGYRHDYPSKIKLDGVLGGKKELQKLVKYCSENKIGLYPDVDLLTAYSSSNGFWPVFDAARYLDATEAKVSELSLATKQEREEDGLKDPFRYIISPGKLSGLVDGFLKKYQKFSFDGISLRTMGSELYSDYDREETYSRPTAQTIVTDQLSKIAAQVPNIMINKGNSYAIEYANKIVDVPVDHSSFMLTDCSVPFYQAVFHGYVEMFGPAMNFSDNITQSVLRSIEYGVGLQYQLIYQPSSFLKNTEYDLLYCSNYLDLMPEISQNYQLVNEALQKVSTAEITDHRQLADNVFVTVYNNNIKVYVNYNSQAVQIEDVSINAQSFVVKEG